MIASGGNSPGHSSIRTTPRIGVPSINDLLAAFLRRGALHTNRIKTSGTAAKHSAQPLPNCASKEPVNRPFQLSDLTRAGTHRALIQSDTLLRKQVSG